MLVEDEDLRGAVIGLMRHHLGAWPSEEKEWPVFISKARGVEDILNENQLTVQLQQSDISTFGIVVDADSDAAGRWESIRNFCKKLGGVGIPDGCPEDGLILENIKERRFGAWIMPNNKDNGMLENFCHGLVPDDVENQWDYATKCVADAKGLGAPFLDVHRFKAQMHTWLAWQDPPGVRMGIAITKHILDPTKGGAPQFSAWFKALYQL
jgi:hypothetical protein